MKVKPDPVTDETFQKSKGWLKLRAPLNIRHRRNVPIIQGFVEGLQGCCEIGSSKHQRNSRGTERFRHVDDLRDIPAANREAVGVDNVGISTSR
eukprot:scaffold2069_cov187-Amphora_coffeaeformis.AAC.3